MGWFEGKSTGSHDLGLPWFTNAASLVVLDFQTYKYHITYYLLKGQYNNIWSRYLMYWKNRTMTNANSTNETRLCSLSSTEMSKWSKQFCLCPVLHPNCPQTSAVSICNSHHGVHSTAQNFNAGLAMLVDCLVNWAQSVCYSLVNIQKTLENHDCSCVNQQPKWPCSIANWNKWPEAKPS